MRWFGRGGPAGEHKDLVNFDGLRRIANDLTKLEVNTIVKSDLTARKMPPPPLAVLEVAVQYWTWLEKRGAALEELTREDLEDIRDRLRQAVAAGPSAAYKDEDLISQGVQAFEALSAAAKPLMDEDAIALRIFDSSLFLARLIAHYGPNQAAKGARPGELVSGDAVALRKIWEVGTQSVKMQTIIQLDGDVITYVQESVACNADDPIQKIHSDNVKIAMDSWRFLVTTVGNMASRLINIFIPTGSP